MSRKVIKCVMKGSFVDRGKPFVSEYSFQYAIRRMELLFPHAVCEATVTEPWSGTHVSLTMMYVVSVCYK